LSILKASTIQFGATNILTNSAHLSLRDVKLRYEEVSTKLGEYQVQLPGGTLT
jgi:hypothetical protein